jgi:hypothetical protein
MRHLRAKEEESNAAVVDQIWMLSDMERILISRSDVAMGRAQTLYSATGNSRGIVSHLDGVLTCEVIPIGQIAMTGCSISESKDKHPGFAASSHLLNPYGSKSRTFNANALHAERFECVPIINFLRVWRGVTNDGVDADILAWIHYHRSFSLHGRTLREWAAWKTHSYGGVVERMRSARKRQEGLLIWERRTFYQALLRE